MHMLLNEIEPYNISKTSSEDGQKFFRRLSGRQSFDWEGSVKPKCMLLDCIIYKESRGLNTVTGHLMSISVDKYFELLDIGISNQGIFEEYKIGWIQIDYRTDEDTPNVSIKAYADNPVSSVSSKPSTNSPKQQAGFNSISSHSSSAFKSAGYSGLSSSSQSVSSDQNKFTKYIVAGVICLVLFIAIGFALTNSKPEAPQPAVQRVTKEANLRSSPVKGKNIVATVPKGSSVTVIENNGEWVKVRFNSTEGYIKSNLVTLSQQ